MRSLLRYRGRILFSANATLDCLADVAMLCVSLGFATAQVTFQPVTFQTADGIAPQAVWPVTMPFVASWITSGCAVNQAQDGLSTLARITPTICPRSSTCR